MAGPFLNSGGGRRQPGRFRPMADINVTPFVDVMLVLLVVFMITAPLLSVGVPVELPRASADPLASNEKPLTISVDRTGKVFLQETEVDPKELVPRLQAISKNNTEARIYVRGDKNVDYGAVMQVMGRIHAAGFTRVALVAELPRQEK
ncbi:MAG TPA: protein TolR [Alphaproteobacteria bacterium]|nr:protein TolR [Alphaproteobacteria bacterium]